MRSGVHSRWGSQPANLGELNRSVFFFDLHVVSWAAALDRVGGVQISASRSWTLEGSDTEAARQHLHIVAGHTGSGRQVGRGRGLTRMHSTDHCSSLVLETRRMNAYTNDPLPSSTL
eukprot:1321907-Pleurochrysis_carterae.AAC.4